MHERQGLRNSCWGAHCGRWGAGWGAGTAAQPHGQHRQSPWMPAPHPDHAGASQLRPRLLPALPSAAGLGRWQARPAPPPRSRHSSLSQPRSLRCRVRAVSARSHARRVGAVACTQCQHGQLTRRALTGAGDLSTSMAVAPLASAGAAATAPSAPALALPSAAAPCSA